MELLQRSDMIATDTAAAHSTGNDLDYDRRTRDSLNLMNLSTNICLET